MPERLEPKFYVLWRWLKEPSAEYNVWTLSARVGLGELMIRRLLTQLDHEGFVQVRRKGFPRTFHLVDPARARSVLQSMGVDIIEGGES